MAKEGVQPWGVGPKSCKTNAFPRKADAKRLLCTT